MDQDTPDCIQKAFADRLLLSIKEVAELLEIDAKTMRRHIADGRIRYVDVGTGALRPIRRFTKAQVLEFLHRQSKVQVPVQIGRRTRFPAGLTPFGQASLPVGPCPINRTKGRP